jgi:hypothetical protein
MEDAAHTISQRLRQLKKIPAELIPLGTLFCHIMPLASVSLRHVLYKLKLTLCTGVVLA